MVDQLIKELNLLAQEFRLTGHQVDQFAQYALLLKKASQEFNITTITHDKDMVSYHFKDSLMISNYCDFKTITGCADVGSGGGFPGLPLKILFPDIPMILIEVNEKKIHFLKEVIQTLVLPKIEVCTLDWRTFLRKTLYPIDLFLSRASLHPDELLKMFKPSSPYKQAKLVYWASEQWNPQENEKQYIAQEQEYRVGNRKRRFIFFSNN